MADKATKPASPNIDSTLQELRKFQPPEEFRRRAHLKSLELDQVAIVSVRGFGRQSGDSCRFLGKNREERCVIDFRHLFAL